jgi:hypothetical protein
MAKKKSKKDLPDDAMPHGASEADAGEVEEHATSPDVADEAQAEVAAPLSVENVPGKYKKFF